MSRYSVFITFLAFLLDFSTSLIYCSDFEDLGSICCPLSMIYSEEFKILLDTNCSSLSITIDIILVELSQLVAMICLA